MISIQSLSFLFSVDIPMAKVALCYGFAGEVRSFYFFIQNGLLSERSAGRFDMIWSVDTRPWNPVLTVNKLNQITFGTIRELVVNMDVASARIGVQLKVSLRTKILCRARVLYIFYILLHEILIFTFCFFLHSFSV